MFEWKNDICQFMVIHNLTYNFFQILNPTIIFTKKFGKNYPLVFLSSCTSSSKCYFEQVDLNLSIWIGVFF
jgi:hypothetical protein